MNNARQRSLPHPSARELTQQLVEIKSCRRHEWCFKINEQTIIRVRLVVFDSLGNSFLKHFLHKSCSLSSSRLTSHTIGCALFYYIQYLNVHCTVLKSESIEIILMVIFLAKILPILSNMIIAKLAIPFPHSAKSHRTAIVTASQLHQKYTS